MVVDPIFMTQGVYTFVEKTRTLYIAAERLLYAHMHFWQWFQRWDEYFNET